MLVSGVRLQEVAQTNQRYIDLFQRMKQEGALDYQRMIQWLILKLSKPRYEDKYGLDQIKDANTLDFFSLYSTQVRYILGQYDQAMDAALEYRKHIEMFSGMLCVPEFYFYEALLMAALYPTAKGRKKRHCWKVLQQNRRRMKKWTMGCPANFQHKYLLIKAEMARVRGQERTAGKLYDQAIASALEHDLVQNAAIANELAAKLYLQQGQTKIAALYLQDARYGYQQWGAHAKVQQLENQYPEQLRLSLVPVRAAQNEFFTTSGSLTELDFSTLLKACQTLSSEIVIEQLVTRLMQYVIGNAGAERSYLLLPKQDNWIIKAQGPVPQNKSCLSLAKAPICHSIVNYVKRTQTYVVLDNVGKEPLFADDPYVIEKQPKSVLCMPLNHQQQLIGILYLENNLSSNVFTPKHLEVLQVLASQAAISLQTAQLYATLQQEINERKRLEKQLLEISDREQRRIGQDLHDGLGQQLTGIKLLVKHLHNRLTRLEIPESKIATEINSQVKEAIKQTRALAQGLYLVRFQQIGLLAAMTEMATNISERYDIDCRFEADAEINLQEPTQITHLYRITQEAINNAIKHGCAKMIHIHLSGDNGHLRLRIHDNGTGVVSPATTSGIGILTMQSRAAMLGGKLDIQPHQDTGTIVTCSFPQL